jgi:hypothetical protein
MEDGMIREEVEVVARAINSTAFAEHEESWAVHEWPKFAEAARRAIAALDKMRGGLLAQSPAVRTSDSIKAMGVALDKWMHEQLSGCVFRFSSADLDEIARLMLRAAVGMPAVPIAEQAEAVESVLKWAEGLQTDETNAALTAAAETLRKMAGLPVPEAPES